MNRLATLIGLSAALAGCQFVPEVTRQPSIHNPFPQLSRVAVVEFFNGTSDDTVVDGLQFAIAYSNELQTVPGYEVVAPDIVNRQLRDLNLRKEDMADPHKRRLLAEALQVDAVVTGVVTEYSPYTPPRLGMQVDWYAANPCFHPIPPGYGLPWGTPQEEEIPDDVVFEAEMALARAQMKTQTPLYDAIVPDTPSRSQGGEAVPASVPASVSASVSASAPGCADPSCRGAGRVRPATDKPAVEPPASRNAPPGASPAERGENSGLPEKSALLGDELPPDWPDPRGFIPHPPSAKRPPCVEQNEPVMSHTRVYNGHDVQFTAALRNYYYSRDEARFGGWQAYLQRSDDFIRFCCHMHIAELLTLRGGAGKSRLVWHWSVDR